MNLFLDQFVFEWDAISVMVTAYKEPWDKPTQASYLFMISFFLALCSNHSISRPIQRKNRQHFEPIPFTGTKFHTPFSLVPMHSLVPMQQAKMKSLHGLFGKHQEQSNNGEYYCLKLTSLFENSFWDGLEVLQGGNNRGYNSSI